MKRYLLVLLAALTFVACSEDEDVQDNTIIVVNADGTILGGHTFSVIDPMNFYIDNIKYTFVDDHLVVSGYKSEGFIGKVEIPSRISLSGKDYDVLEIGYCAFMDCTALSSISIPSSVTTIGECAFLRCTELQFISIPASVTTIGKYAFQVCTSLSKAEFASIEHLCGITFLQAYSNPVSQAHHLYIKGKEVKKVVIPSDITTLKDFTFFGASELTSVSIPNGVTEIGQSTFEGCSGLTSLTIPNSVTQIGKYAFQFCSGLTSLSIGNGVTFIGMKAFQACDGLISLTIPNNVEVIGAGAFNYCIKLEEVISLIENPFIVWYPFHDETFLNATLYVPVGTIDKYRATDGWKNFVHIVERLP